jgi:protein-disulfide isomerase
MVICIIALPVLALLGLFSLKYRMLAGEAFRCLFRTVQLKPCDSGLDLRIKSKFTAKLMWWPAFARFFYKYFTLLSWIFVILMLLSAGFTGYGLYNYFVYGNCNGANSGAFCIFNPTHTGGAEQCSSFAPKQEVNLSKLNLTGAHVRGDRYAPYYMIEFGCYSCSYTKEAESVVRKILTDYPDVQLFYLDVPLPIHEFSVEAGGAAICAGAQNKYWAYHDKLFEDQGNLTTGKLIQIASEVKVGNIIEFIGCTQRNSTEQEIIQAQNHAFAAGVYGTPTFIMGNEVLVGPQSYETLKAAIEKEK